MHSTHCPLSLQSGAPASGLQSAFVRHVTHLPRDEHSGVAGVPAQSGAARHWTQLIVVVLHFGVGAAHWVSTVQPVTHVKSAAGLHTGLAAGQSTLPRHDTHSFFAGLQRGFVAGHCVSTVHCTHCFVVGSQTFLSPVQSALVLHSMHWPIA